MVVDSKISGWVDIDIQNTVTTEQTEDEEKSKFTQMMYKRYEWKKKISLLCQLAQLMKIK